MSMQRQWPQLGRELFTLESALTGTAIAHEIPLTERESTVKRAGNVPFLGSGRIDA
jgi:hypothetical protein